MCKSGFDKKRSHRQVRLGGGMSTPEKRKRLKAYYQECNKVYAANAERGYRPAISAPSMSEDLRDLQCGAKTSSGTTCKQKAIYANGRCKWHGGCSTGPNTAEGKNAQP